MIWIKIVHILCIMGWMTGIFAVPRALIFWHREFSATGTGGPAGELTIRLYRFSALLGVIGICTGLWLAWQLQFPLWSLIKLGLVGLLLAYYVYTGLLVKQAHGGIFTKSDKFLRIFNESSVLLVILILYLVVAQPY